MDDRRFDHVARSVGHGMSRRGVIHGFLAGLAAIVAGRQGAAAQRGSRLIGEPGTRDQQCSQAGDLGQVSCADNGFDYDGPLNCCAPEGGRCFADEGCCGYAWYGGGVCQGAAGNPSTPQEENPFNVGLGQGEYCVNSGQCSSPSTPLYCDENLNDGAGYRCCALAGGTCGSSFGCCGYLSCLGAFCG